MTQHHSLARTAAAIALTAAAAGASLFAPEWSRPLPSEVVSFAVWQRQDGPDDLMLLLADGRVFAVSGTDTITLLGRAPSGTRAIAAVPSQSSVNNRQSDIGMALLLAGSRLVAWDRQGTELWQKPAGVLAGCDSLAFVGWHEGVTWLIARGANDLLLVTVGAGTLGIDTIVPGMRARAVQMLDVDGSGLPEVCATDGRRVCIGHLDENRRTDIYWPSPPLSLASIASPPTAILAVADPDNTGTTRLLVVTGDTLRCLDPLSGRQEWFAAAGMGLPGAPRAVAGTVSRAYVAGADSAGRLWLAVVKRNGAAEPVLYPDLPAGTRVVSLSTLGCRPLLSVRTGYGAENLLFYSAGLDGRSAGSTGYSGARLRRAIAARFDDDTFPDLAVIRTAGDAPLRVDLFINRMGALLRDLAEARADLAAAVAAGDDNATRRAVRRIALVNAEIRPGRAATTAERKLLSELSRQVSMHVPAWWAIGLGALILAAGLSVLLLTLPRRRRSGPRGQQVEDKPLPVRVALAADLVALDHNFVSKGNKDGALDRLLEIRARHGLVGDRDLGRLAGNVGPCYSSVITRLIDQTPTVNLLELVEKTARRDLGGRPFAHIEMSRERLRRELLSGSTEPQPGGVRIILVRNTEYPDIHLRVRWFASPESVSALEHFIIDHINYSRNWAAIVLDYTVSTQWTRRSILMLYSDAPTAIDFENPHGHTASQLAEIAASMRPAIEVPGLGFKPLTPAEKLWLRSHDYISVLEETRARLAAAEAGTHRKDAKARAIGEARNPES
jgi:hypothetical protein